MKQGFRKDAAVFRQDVTLNMAYAPVKVKSFRACHDLLEDSKGILCDYHAFSDVNALTWQNVES